MKSQQSKRWGRPLRKAWLHISKIRKLMSCLKNLFKRELTWNSSANLKKNRDALEKIAQTLLDKEVLEGSEFEALAKQFTVK